MKVIQRGITYLSPMNPSLDKMFGAKLKTDEKMLWTGRPKQGFLIRDADLILIPMSIILAGFCVILDYTLFVYTAPLSIMILAALLSVSMTYFTIGRFIMSRIRRSKIFYCITSKRVLVLNGKKKKLKTLPLKNIEQLDKTLEKDGSGFIIFGTTNPLYPWLLGGFYFSTENIPGLEVLPDVNTPFSILENEIRIELSPEVEKLLHTNDEERFN